MSAQRRTTTGVYQALKDDIMHFEFRPGERLFEERLSERYQVSRTPIREALRSLEEEGLVVSHGNGVRCVQDFDINAYEDLYQVRLALEDLSVQEASTHGRPEDVQVLAATWDEGQPANETSLDGTYVVADERFHIGLAELSGNTYLVDSLQRIFDRLHAIRSVDFTTRDRLLTTYEEHSRILAAVQDGAADEARALMRAHILESKSNIEDLVTRVLKRIYIGSAG